MTFFILLLSVISSKGQTDFRVMSYNVENLFDTEDNPLTADEEFLPSGNRHWTGGRFYHKLQQVAKDHCRWRMEHSGAGRPLRSGE